MYCKNCGKVIKQGEKFCTNCGAKLENEINSSVENNVIQNNQSQTFSSVNILDSNDTKKSKWKNTISLVIGIICLVWSFVLQIFIIPLSIVGIIFGIMGIKENKKNKAGLILNIISFALAIPTLLLYLNTNAIDDEFREYLITNYNFNLAEKSKVGRCRVECDYFGYYPLADDLTYAIQISKTGDEYEVSYDTQALKMRKQLYEYISTQKGNNYVENYLQFYDNGDKGHVSSSYSYGDHFSYIVYYDESIDIDKQIYSDYQILQKASNIMSANSEQFISVMDVYYIKDVRLKDVNWLENINIEVDYYIWAPSYLDGDKELSTEKYTYHYSITDSKNHGDIGNWTFEQFKEKVYEKLETK